MSKCAASKPKIAVFLNGISDYYQHTICEGIAAQAEKLGFSVFFFASRVTGDINENNEGELKLFKLPRMHSFSGIIVATNTITSPETVAYLKAALPADSIPVVNIGPSVNGSYSVDSVDQHSMEALIRHFIVDHRFTRINFISGPPGNPDARHRLNAYKKVLKEFGIAYDESRVYIGDFNRECAREAVARFLRNGGELPQAIVCANDNIALGAYAELTRLGIRVPEQIALSGYDGVHDAERHLPRITTIRQPLREMGERAVRIISDVTAGKHVRKEFRYHTEIVVAGSCGCADRAPMDQKQLVQEFVLEADNLRICDNISSSMMELLTGAYTMQDVVNQLAALTHVLDFRHFYFCLNEDSLMSRSQTAPDYPDSMTLMLGMVNGVMHTGLSFRTEDLLPSLDTDTAALVFAPLYYKSRTFGYMAFDFSHSSTYMHRIWVKNVRLALENFRTQDELRRYSAALEDISIHDPLTGVLNRRGLEKRAQSLLSGEQGMVYVIFVDLDGLKLINDVYGHAAGDEAIQVIADVLKHCSRPGDIVARMGGDEFVCVGLTPDEDTVRSVIFSMQSYGMLYNEHSGKPYAVNASYGWYVAGRDEDISLIQMISKADSRLYEQKRLRSRR